MGARAQRNSRPTSTRRISASSSCAPPYLGLLFVTLGEATPPLDEWLGESMRSTLRVVLAGDGRLKLLGYQKVRYAVNWKAYNDNDGFHAPLLHRRQRAAAGATLRSATPRSGDETGQLPKCCLEKSQEF